MMLLVLAVIHSVCIAHHNEIAIDDYDKSKMFFLPPPQVLAEALLLLPPSVDRQVALFSFGPEDYLEGKDGGDDDGGDDGGDGESMDYGDDCFNDDGHY